MRIELHEESLTTIHLTIPSDGRLSESDLDLAAGGPADPAFRTALLADPRSTISELISMPIPDAVGIELHEESLTTIHLTVPADSLVVDDDLELVTGGDAIWGSCCGIGAFVQSWRGGARSA